MSEMTRRLASLHFQRLWASRWGELEDRLCRVELFMDVVSPITVAQHALLRSETVHPQLTVLENGEKGPGDRGSAAPEVGDGLGECQEARNSSGTGAEEEDEGEKTFYEKELMQRKDIFHEVCRLSLRGAHSYHIITAGFDRDWSKCVSGKSIGSGQWRSWTGITRKCTRI